MEVEFLASRNIAFFGPLEVFKRKTKAPYPLVGSHCLLLLVVFLEVELNIS